jgi:hypothetical protein
MTLPRPCDVFGIEHEQSVIRCANVYPEFTGMITQAGSPAAFTVLREIVFFRGKGIIYMTNNGPVH